MTCDTCGGDMRVGDFPFCHGDASKHRPGVNNIEAVTWPGGRVFENLGHEPVRCDSPADLKRELKARNLEPMVRHVPVLGSDYSPHTSDWSKGSIDPQTLQNAVDLVTAHAARHGRRKEPAPQTYIESLTLSTSYSEDTVRLR